MDEFQFLDAQFRRLREAGELRFAEENGGALGKGVHSKFETAELMIAGAIRDYLKFRNSLTIMAED